MKKSIIFHFTIDCDWIPNSEKSLPKLFDIIEKFNIKPTFFLTGTFAEHNKDFVVEMRMRDYELGCHGLNHGLDASENFGYKTPFLEQKRLLSMATEIIHKVSGKLPRIFRAPLLEISVETYKVLDELGYQIDSSIPSRRFDFGFGSVNGLSNFIKTSSPYIVNYRILEIPPSAFILPFNMRMLRIFGSIVGEFLFRFLEFNSNILVFYLHPSEFLSASYLHYPKEREYFFLDGGMHNYQILESFLNKINCENIVFEKMGSHIGSINYKMVLV